MSQRCVLGSYHGILDPIVIMTCLHHQKKSYPFRSRQPLVGKTLSAY